MYYFLYVVVVVHNKGNNTMAHQEHQYLALIRRVLGDGIFAMDRTNVGTTSLFGAQMRFSLVNGVVPILTTKRVAINSVIKELLWFIAGGTSSKTLDRRGVKIWNANGSRKFLQSRGQGHREEGDLGPIYGFQWRHWGAEYKTATTDYTNQGIDQLAQVIEGMRLDPHGRRHVLSAWNVGDLHAMALPPCHMIVQFYIRNGKLSAMLTQRSADLGLGVPFNIASYSILVHILAHLLGLEAYEFVYSIGDAHVYANHTEALLLQLERDPLPFPTLEIKAPIGGTIDDYKFEDFIVHNYKCHTPIVLNMAV